MNDELPCSPDGVHDPVHAAYTTTNATEVSLGLTGPLPPPADASECARTGTYAAGA